MAVLLYPPIVKKLHVAKAFGANGNNIIINAPGAGTEIVIAHFYLQNTTAVATIAQLMAGSFAFFIRLFQTQGSDFGITYPQGLEERLGISTTGPNPLVLNLNGANSFNVVVGYWLDTKQ